MVEMRGELHSPITNLYLFTCTNPNHAYSVWRVYKNGRFVPVRLKPPRNAPQYRGDSVYFSDDGKTEKKMSKAMYEDITSRAVTSDGQILRGQKGINYNMKQQSR